MNAISKILATTEPIRQATGFVFTEGPVWHPNDVWYFNDIRPGAMYRMVLGEAPELIRKTEGGNGMTFDLEGRLVQCEGEGNRISRAEHDGTVSVLVDRFEGRRFNRPNDIICHSDGSLYFTDPSMRIPFDRREQPGTDGEDGVYAGACVYRISSNGEDIKAIFTCEYPNGLALSPDERTLYVANTRSTQYIHAVDIDKEGRASNRRIFADLSGAEPGIPDGMKVDQEGRVFCTGPGGIWVHEPDGTHIGIIRLPEMAVNFAFGGSDLTTLFVCAVTSVYTLQVKTPGLPHPWYLVR
ncbi:MAG: SMP-30/gluconolactonase/LRE family protein [Pseudomonadota bacterium]|nr:SMP-30/gluconolactonase/LRE family protein [Pseudomonadota bacterium]MEC8773328.1 SMP-30/gluconolactonase/LRE family protein [Pseudomonadota bacterium]